MHGAKLWRPCLILFVLISDLYTHIYNDNEYSVYIYTHTVLCMYVYIYMITVVDRNADARLVS